jgi:hypothetical protein
MALGLGPTSAFSIAALPTQPVFFDSGLTFSIGANITGYLREIWQQSQTTRALIAVEINYVVT